MNNRLHKTIFNRNTCLKYLLFVGLLCLSQITFANIYNIQYISGNLNTDLTGGIITSTANAEQNGKNSFETGTITFADLANKAEYKGEGFSIGTSGTGYGKDKENQASITKAGINTANITIRDNEKQQQITGKTAEEIIKAVKTNITLENHQNLSGRLNNNFDAKKVKSEIDLQVEVTKEFSNNVRDFQSKQNKRLDELKEKKDKGEISQKEYQEQAQKIEQQKLITNVVAGGLLSPADSLTGIAVSAVSPAVSYKIGRYFKGLADQNPNGELTASQKTAHIAAHAILGAVTANANGGNALSGAVSAGGAEYIAQVTANTLFNKKAEDLTADEKQTVSTISQLVGTISGSVMGDSSLNAYVGGSVASNAVDNNYLGYWGKNNQKDFAKDLSRDCGKNGNPEQCAKTYNKYKEISYKQGFAYQGEESKWEEYVAATYENKILPLCKGNSACKMAAIQDMQVNLVLYAGAPGEFKHAVEHSAIATNIKNGNWGTLGLQAFGDLTLLTGVRGLVNPNSAYARLMNSAITPSRASASLPSGQIGSIGFNAQTAENVDKYKQQAKEVAQQNGWVKDSKLSKINKRDVYKSKDGKNFYAHDSYHNTFEKTNSKGKHQGEFNMAGEKISSADKTGKHDLKVK